MAQSEWDRQETHGGLLSALDDIRSPALRDLDGDMFLHFLGGAGLISVGLFNPYALAGVYGQSRDIVHTINLLTETRLKFVDCSTMSHRTDCGTRIVCCSAVRPSPSGSESESRNSLPDQLSYSRLRAGITAVLRVRLASNPRRNTDRNRELSP